MAMKNFYLVFTTLLFFNFNVQAQFVSDFEDCPEDGVPIPVGGNPWSEWGCGGGPGCSIMCTTEQVQSGDFAGKIPDDTTTNTYLDLGNRIFSQWGLEFWMYIPSGNEAYLSLQGAIPIGNGDWLVGNVFFNQDNENPGVGHIDDSALGDVYFNFPHDQWFRVVMNFDISLGLSIATWQFNVDGVDVLPFGTAFTDFEGNAPSALGAIHFSSTSIDSTFYLDDFNFIDGFIDPQPNPGPFTDDMEGEQGDWWIYPIMTTTSQAHSPVTSGYIPGDGTTDVLLDLGNQTSGVWSLEFWQYIPSGRVAYWNLQGEVPVGSGEWIVGNVFFNQDNVNPGVGLIDDTALGEVNFNFPHDQWFKVVMNWDITNGISLAIWEMYVDGEEVIPEGTPFTNSDGDVPTSLGGIDFFSISTDNELYLDDFNYVEGLLGTSDFAKLEFTVYPNPSRNYINIETQDLVKYVTIYNLQGMRVKETTKINTVDVSSLSTGLYFVEVSTETERSVQKFIKE